MRTTSFISILLCFHLAVNAQMTCNAVSQNSFLATDISNPIDEYFIQHPDKQFHSSLKPFNYVILNKLNDDKINYKHVGIHNYLMTIQTPDSSKAKNKLRLQILPQINIEQGKDLLTNKWTNNFTHH